MQFVHQCDASPELKQALAVTSSNLRLWRDFSHEHRNQQLMEFGSQEEGFLEVLRFSL